MSAFINSLCDAVLLSVRHSFQKTWAQEECKLSQRQDQSSKWSQETGEVIWNQYEKFSKENCKGLQLKKQNEMHKLETYNDWLVMDVMVKELKLKKFGIKLDVFKC